MDDPRTGEPGLGVDVRPTGRAVFFWRRWVHGKARRIPIGEFPAWSVAAARDRAHELNRERAGGGRPHLTVRLSALWEVYQERHLPTLSEATQRAYRDAWKAAAPLHQTRLADVTRADVARLHADLGDRSQSWANKVRALVSSMLGRAEAWGYLDRAPTLPEPFPAVKRERALARDEAARLLAVVDGHDQPLPDLVRLLLWTAARKAEACAARWDEMDLDARTWTHRQKGGRLVVKALSADAVALLRARRARLLAAKKYRFRPWVFPSVRGSGHIVTPDKPWRAARSEAGLGDLRLHDLRHTWATWAREAGVPMAVIAAQLGHAQISTTERYAHATVDPQHDAVELVNPRRVQPPKASGRR